MEAPYFGFYQQNKHGNEKIGLGLASWQRDAESRTNSASTEKDLSMHSQKYLEGEWSRLSLIFAG